MASDDDDEAVDDGTARILTPDQRVRVFVSSTMEELASERVAVRDAVAQLRLSPVLFELGARSHPPRSLYRSYLEQSHVFVGIYWERYGWVAPSMDISGLEDEYLLAGAKPKLMYVKRPAPGREPQLDSLLDRIRSDDDVAYKAFETADELETLVVDDLSFLLSEAFLVVPSAAARRPSHLALPAEPTAFVGRDAELATIGELLARDDVRLVTLTGPGGIGKTRLALRAAAATSLEEGAAFVPLASVSDPSSVVNAIATAVGIRDTGGPTIESLTTDLASRSLLLVIDNFEHVMSAVDVVAQLLDAAPDLKVLATSREALHLRAEHEFPVPQMPIADGIRLFTDRATAVRPDFRLDDSNRYVVERICRRLEGVPLAIELAAARSKLLAPEALLERLDRRLDFLVGGARDLPERQRALHRTIEWSHDLLDRHERRLFARLGVFVGSFSLSAVEAIVAAEPSGPPDPDEPEVLDVLASLVDQSLVRVEAGAGEPHFRMLGMIGEFARERLAETDEAEAVEERHAAFYRDVGLAVGAGVVEGDQRHWLKMLGGDDDGAAGNVRASLAWYLSHHRLDDFATLAWALLVPAWINGRIDEGTRSVEAALGDGAEMSTASRARLLVLLGMFRLWSGDHARAADVLTAGRAAAAELGDDLVVARATLAQSMIAGSSEGEARCEELANEALATYETCGDAWGEAAALNVLAWLFVSQERFDGTASTFERTLSSSIAAGDEQFSAMAEVNMAEYLLHAGDADGAARLLASCGDRHREVRLMYSAAYLIDAEARWWSADGDHERAARLLGAADHLRASAGVSVWGSQLERRERFAADLRTALGDDAFDAARAEGTSLSYAAAIEAAQR